MNIEQLTNSLTALNKQRAEIMKLIQDTADAAWNINRILYCDEKDRRWIQDNNLSPGSWGLPPEEVAAIRSERLLLGFLFSPSALVKFPPPDFVGPEQVPFVFVDATLMIDPHVQLDRDELISIILHEFGHRLNPVSGADPEHVADDYARQLRGGDHLANALQALRASGRAGFENAGIGLRIQRIRNGEPPFLCERLQRQKPLAGV